MRRRVAQQWAALKACCGHIHCDRDMFEVVRERCDLSKRKLRKLNDGGQAQFEKVVDVMKTIVAELESTHSAMLADGMYDALALFESVVNEGHLHLFTPEHTDVVEEIEQVTLSPGQASSDYVGAASSSGDGGQALAY